MIVDPTGRLLYIAKSFEEEITTLDIDNYKEANQEKEYIIRSQDTYGQIFNAIKL